MTNSSSRAGAWSFLVVGLLALSGCFESEPLLRAQDASALHDSGAADQLDVAPDVDAPHDTSIDAPHDTSSDAPPTPTDTEDAASFDATDTAAPPPPQKEAFFNIPAADGTADTHLEDVLIDLLAQTPTGAEVRASYFTFSRTRVANAFAEAYERGVDVQFILGNTSVHPGCVDWQAPTILKQRLGEGRVTICRECESTGACIGSKINHNKFVTISRMNDGSRHVVVQSSANLTTPQIHQFNNLVVIRDDQALYDGYVDYWHDLKSQQRDDNYYRKTSGDTGTRAYFFPRESGDTVLSILSNLDCSGGARVRLAMAFFTNGRVEVAQKLAEMQRNGCVVEALLGDHPNTPGSSVLQELRDASVTVHVFEETNDVTIHSKYLLLDGKYYDGTPSKLVWTGSHNYTHPALRDNDEVLLKIDDRALYDEFLSNWQTIRSRAQAR